MRHFDLTPLYRHTVGFDRLFSLLDSAGGDGSGNQTYPPYNIEKRGDNLYRITMAIAGFGEQDLHIEVKENALLIRGDKSRDDNVTAGDILYQGIASRGFERRFQLADHVEVTGASLENGLLHVELKREIPEALKPRKIQITAVADDKVIEAKTA